MDSLGKTTGVGSHSLLPGIFPTQRSNPGLQHCKEILHCLSHPVPLGQEETLSREAVILITLVAQKVKNLTAMQENQVQSLGWEDPLEKGMATHSSSLAWRIPWTELDTCKELDTTEQLSLLLLCSSPIPKSRIFKFRYIPLFKGIIHIP